MLYYMAKFSNNKKCPPGVICFENITLVIFLIIFVIFSYLFYVNISRSNAPNNQKIIIKQDVEERNTRNGGFLGAWGLSPNFPYNNLPIDTLYNPLVPPLRDERYLVGNMMFVPPGRVPINVSTSAVETSYRQMGILTPLNNSSKDNILQLMGRPLYVRRSKYQYYAISNQHNNVKLPISIKGRSGLNDNGVDELYNGDTVYVEGYQQAFKVTKYDDDTIKYLPYI
jgi:Family of unknown function (DUF5755)